MSGLFKIAIGDDANAFKTKYGKFLAIFVIQKVRCYEKQDTFVSKNCQSSEGHYKYHPYA